VVLSPVRDLPGHRRARAAALLPCHLYPVRSAACLCCARGFRPGTPSENGGVDEFPLFPVRYLPPLPQVSDRRLQHYNPVRLLAKQRIPRIPAATAV
jgi:hypothetical protein